MATKLKRTLFIGLGGTGMKSILKTKQLYKEAFGEVPSIIGFLGIDTSTEEFAKELKTSDGETVKLDANEQVQLKITQPGAYYQQHKERFGWIPKRNVAALSGLSANGAGQIRTNGRFSFTINYAQIESSIDMAVKSVRDALNEGQDKWELVDDKLQIYMVFSLSGGTGCGIFLNLAFLIKEMMSVDGCVLNGYAVLPNIYHGCGQFVGANAYGAMLDTDYIMKNVTIDNPFTIELLNEDREVNYQPFDLVYLVDNMTKYGDTYTDPNQLYTMIGQALLCISGSIGSASAQDLDNFKQIMIEGSLDIEDKKAWVSGMGLCEILVNIKKLSRKFKLKAGSRLLSTLIGLEDVTGMNDITMQWINGNQLREHEDDQLLNSLYDMGKIPESAILVKKAKDAVDESDRYINDGLSEANRQIVQNYGMKMTAVKAAFDAKLNELIINEKGLRGAKEFIKKLNDALDLYNSEMVEEGKALSDRLSQLKSAVSETLESWKNKGLFDRTDYKSVLADDQEAYLRNLVEKSRRDKASQFFIEFKGYINTYLTHLNETIASLLRVNEMLGESLIREELSTDTNPFQIDLAKDTEVDGIDPDCTISKYLNYLKTAKLMKDAVKSDPMVKDKELLGLHLLDIDVIKESVMGFANTLTGANFDDMSLEAIIMKLSDEEKKKLFEKALRKAEIVLDIKQNGYNNEGALRNALYISVMGGQSGPIAQDKVINSILSAETGSSRPVYAAAPTDKSIMIFRQKGVFPVFQVATIEAKKRDHEKYSENKSFSFDAKIEERISDIHFGFTPNKQTDETVMEMWVKGLIFHFIKREGQRYMVWSPAASHNDASNDYWLKLKAPEEGHGTEARFYAFEDFKSKKRDLMSKNDLMAKIKEKEDEMGRAAITDLYKRISGLKAEDYVNEISCANIDNKTIIGSLSYRQTKAVLEEEHKYRKTKLVDSINR